MPRKSFEAIASAVVAAEERDRGRHVGAKGAAGTPYARHTRHEVSRKWNTQAAATASTHWKDAPMQAAADEARQLAKSESERRFHSDVLTKAGTIASSKARLVALKHDSSIKCRPIDSVTLLPGCEWSQLAKRPTLDDAIKMSAERTHAVRAVAAMHNSNVAAHAQVRPLSRASSARRACLRPRLSVSLDLCARALVCESVSLPLCRGWAFECGSVISGSQPPSNCGI